MPKKWDFNIEYVKTGKEWIPWNSDAVNKEERLNNINEANKTDSLINLSASFMKNFIPYYLYLVSIGNS